MNVLMILSHAAVRSHLHAAELVPIALVTMLAAVVVILAFRRRSAAGK